jgi:hypothetical protein
VLNEGALLAGERAESAAPVLVKISDALVAPRTQMSPCRAQMVEMLSGLPVLPTMSSGSNAA